MSFHFYNNKSYMYGRVRRRITRQINANIWERKVLFGCNNHHDYPFLRTDVLNSSRTYWIPLKYYIADIILFILTVCFIYLDLVASSSHTCKHHGTISFYATLWTFLADKMPRHINFVWGNLNGWTLRRSPLDFGHKHSKQKVPKAIYE